MKLLIFFSHWLKAGVVSPFAWLWHFKIHAHVLDSLFTLFVSYFYSSSLVFLRLFELFSNKAMLAVTDRGCFSPYGVFRQPGKKLTVKEEIFVGEKFRAFRRIAARTTTSSGLTANRALQNLLQQPSVRLWQFNARLVRSRLQVLDDATQPASRGRASVLTSLHNSTSSARCHRRIRSREIKFPTKISPSSYKSLQTNKTHVNGPENHTWRLNAGSWLLMITWNFHPISFHFTFRSWPGHCALLLSVSVIINAHINQFIKKKKQKKTMPLCQELAESSSFLADKWVGHQDLRGYVWLFTSVTVCRKATSSLWLLFAARLHQGLVENARFAVGCVGYSPRSLLHLLLKL